MSSLIIIALLLLSECAGLKQETVKKRFIRMDTVVDVTLVADNTRDFHGTWLGLDSLLVDWGERFSQTHPKSEVRRLNVRSSREITVGVELEEMIATALAYGDTLKGSFDITLFPVKDLWGFGEEDTSLYVPTKPELEAALQKTGREKVSVAEGRVSFADDEVTVDIGGIAKGAALRQMAMYLDSLGYTDYLVVAGGDIVSHGTRADGEPWRIGVQHPRKAGSLLAVLDLDSGSIVTSGDYERFFMRDGVRYHHIFDPATGESCRKNQSLTVWSNDPIEADVLSTGLFCLPANEIVSFVNARARLECIAIDSLGNRHVSNGWKSRVQFVE